MYTAATTDGTRFRALQDLSSYALCARTRVQLGNKLTLNGVIEAPDALLLRDRVQYATGGSSGGSRQSKGGDSLAAHIVLKAALPGHDLTAAVGHNMDYVESSGDYARVPLAVSLDLSSLDRADGLQYRVGLHQVTAPPTEIPLNAQVRSDTTAVPAFPRQSRTVLHAQGAVAVEGEAYLWRGSGGAPEKPLLSTSGSHIHAPPPPPPLLPPPSSPASSVPTSEKDSQPLNQQQQQGEGEQEDEASGSSKSAPISSSTNISTNINSTNGDEGMSNQGDEDSSKPAGRVSEALASAAAADSGEFIKRQGAGLQDIVHGKGLKSEESRNKTEDGAATGPSTGSTISSIDGDSVGGKTSEGGVALRKTEASSSAATPSGGVVLALTNNDSTTQQQQQQQASTSPLSLETYIKPLERLGNALQAVTNPQHQEKKEDPAPGSTQPPPRLIPITSQSVSAAIADSLTALRNLKDTVSRVTSDVQDGSLQRLSQQLSMRQPQRRRPYSMLLAQPHVKLNAAMGCLARMPLPPLRAFIPGGSAGNVDHHYHPGSGSQPGFPTTTGGGNLGYHRRTTSTSSMASRASISSQLAEAWEPYLKGTALRVFASAGISGQLGRFTRPVLDYTAASLRVDVGLSSPHVLGSVPGPGAVSSALDEANRPDKHRAFALEGRGSWHALSVSLAQQIVGPVRARADFRFALDPTNVPQDQGERSTLKGLTQTALSVRPSLLEAVYGADMVLPGTEGAARVAVWWSPKRREAMAELRLF